ASPVTSGEVFLAPLTRGRNEAGTVAWPQLCNLLAGHYRLRARPVWNIMHDRPGENACALGSCPDQPARVRIRFNQALVLAATGASSCLRIADMVTISNN